MCATLYPSTATATRVCLGGVVGQKHGPTALDFQFEIPVLFESKLHKL